MRERSAWCFPPSPNCPEESSPQHQSEPSLRRPHAWSFARSTWVQSENSTCCGVEWYRDARGNCAFISRSIGGPTYHLGVSHGLSPVRLNPRDLRTARLGGCGVDRISAHDDVGLTDSRCTCSSWTRATTSSRSQRRRRSRGHARRAGKMTLVEAPGPPRSGIRAGWAGQPLPFPGERARAAERTARPHPRRQPSSARARSPGSRAASCRGPARWRGHCLPHARTC